MSKSLLYIKKGGRFAEGSDLRAAFENVAGPHIRRGVMKVQAGTQGETPIGPTGNLRRGWYTAPPEWVGTRLISRLGNKMVYARRVNRTSRLNKGYIERGVQGALQAGMEIIRGGLGELAAHIWRASK